MHHLYVLSINQLTLNLDRLLITVEQMEKKTFWKLVRVLILVRIINLVRLLITIE